jgi:hypothetical protein
MAKLKCPLHILNVQSSSGQLNWNVQSSSGQTEMPNLPGAALQRGCGGVEHSPTRQQIGKLLSQSAKLDWLKITSEKTKIDFLNNWIQTEYHGRNPETLNISQIYSFFITLNLANRKYRIIYVIIIIILNVIIIIILNHLYHNVARLPSTLVRAGYL